MAKREHLELIRQGKSSLREWRTQNPELHLDLNGAEFIQSDLSELDFRGANLYGANLSRANLNKVNLSKAVLNRANLQEATLQAAKLNGAQMRLAKLNGAKLSYADLSRANLYEADLNGTDLDGADLYGADLSRTILSKQEEISSPQIANIAKADPANIQEVAAAQLAINRKYYENALEQSQRSFLSALVWASIGTILIVAAIIFLIVRQPSNLSYVSLIGGAIVEAIAGLNFYLYGRASNQLTTFQTPLDRIGRFLIANSVCENLDGEIKHSTRAKLVEAIAIFPATNDSKEIDHNSNIELPRIERSIRTRTTRHK